MPNFFEVKRYRVTTERRKDTIGNTKTLSEAVVVLKIGDKERFQYRKAWMKT